MHEKPTTAFDLKDLSARNHRLADSSAKVVLVRFRATACELGRDDSRPYNS